MKLTNRLGLPEAIVKAVQKGRELRGEIDSDLTASQIETPPQLVRLKKLHENEIVEDVADRLWALFGELTHVLLERAAPDGEQAERRYYRDIVVDGKEYRVSGAADNIQIENGILSDWKTSSVYAAKSGAKREWVTQLNTLRWLVSDCGEKVKSLQVIVLCRDWSQSDSRRESNYPERVAILKVPMWTDEQVEERIRLAIREQILDAEPRACTPDDQWRRNPKYAVMKKGMKRAVRLFEVEQDAKSLALDLGANHYVELRKGQAIRCEDYCPVRDFCPQWKAENGDITNE